jgi:hypothetical protein
VVGWECGTREHPRFAARAEQQAAPFFGVFRAVAFSSEFSSLRGGTVARAAAPDARLRQARVPYCSDLAFTRLQAAFSGQQTTMLAGRDTRNVTLEQLVNEATDELLSEPDYSKQLDIVERVTAFGPAVTPSKCLEVCDAVAVRLDKKKKSENVVYLCLHLLDFMLKNVSPQMGHVMARDSFQVRNRRIGFRVVSESDKQKHIVKLGKGKTVKGKAAVLLVCKVQEWAYLFQNHKGFQQTYIALQKQGHDFPPPSKELMVEQSRANEQRLDSQKRRQEQQQLQQSQPSQSFSPNPSQSQRSSVHGNEGQIKLRNNLIQLRENIGLVVSMMQAVDPVTENVAQNELIGPLLESIGQQRPKIAELIGRDNEEETMELLLGINDEINTAFGYYQQLLRGERPVFAIPEEDEPAVSSPQPPTSVPRASPAPISAPATPSDPFAALAQARHAKSRTSGAAAAPAPAGSLDLLFGSPGPAPVVTHVGQSYAGSSLPPPYTPSNLPPPYMPATSSLPPSYAAPSSLPPSYAPSQQQQQPMSNAALFAPSHSTSSQSLLFGNSNLPPSPAVYAAPYSAHNSPAPYSPGLPSSGQATPVLANPYQNPFMDTGNNNNAAYSSGVGYGSSGVSYGSSSNSNAPVSSSFNGSNPMYGGPRV